MVLQVEMQPAIKDSEAQFERQSAAWAFEKAQLEQRLEVLQGEHSRLAQDLRASDQTMCVPCSQHRRSLPGNTETMLESPGCTTEGIE